MVRLVAIALLGLWLSGAATGTTYTYVGPTYTAAGSPYTTAMSVTGTFDTATPLPANMPETDIGPDGSGLLTAWSFSDGVNTLTQANSSPYPFSFNVATDAEGNITSFSILLLNPQPPNTIGEPLLRQRIEQRKGNVGESEIITAPATWWSSLPAFAAAISDCRC